METLQDLIEEGKVRAIWWAICIFAISYFLSHTSKSLWMNIPISVLIALALRMLTTKVEFRWKVPPPTRKQTFLSHLEKKQLSVNDSRLSTTIPQPRWKRKIDSPIVEAAVEEFIDKIIQDFVVDLWYSDITPDKEVPQQIRATVLDALGELAVRLKEVNLVDLLTRDIVDLIGDHIELYRRNQASIGVDVMGMLSSEERDERLKHHLIVSKELHPALISPECEYKFLQRLAGGVLAVILRQREAQCPLVRCIAREFFTCLVLQPIINFASPMYINELIEYLLLSNMDVFSRTEGGDLSSEAHNDHSLHIGSVQNAESSLKEDDVSHTQDIGRRPGKSDNWREKASNVLVSPSSNIFPGETFQSRTADWARILDAATQRRTEVLAPENLENMWARGRHYKDKLNDGTRGPRAPGTKGVFNPNTGLMKESLKETLTSSTSNIGTDDKGMHLPPWSGHNALVMQGNNKGTKMSDDLDKEYTFQGGPFIDDVKNTRAVAVDGIRSRLKKSNSTSALRNDLDEKNDNISESKGLFVSEEFYTTDFGRQSVEQRFNGPSDSVIHAEGSHFPKLRCRVIGAYFEKIGSTSFAVYSIAVTDVENNTWFVKRRYRNFERLHRHLKDIPNYNLHLPPKRIFSSSTEDAFVLQRCIQLDKYLQDLLSIANVAEQHEVWDFLSVSSKNYCFGKSSSVMRTLAVNVDDAVDDIVRQFKGASSGLMRKVAGSSSHYEGLPSVSVRNLSWNADELKSHSSMNSSIETYNSISDNEEGGKDGMPGHEEARSGAQANGWHSDNELNTKYFPPRVFKGIEDYESSNSEKKHGAELNSEWKDAGGSSSLPVLSDHVDPVGVPLEWTPSNVSVPVLNLVDKIFLLNRRGWIRRQVFWISKQILQLVMEDAIDDWLIKQINWLRREDAIAQGIRWVQDVLWPDGKFFLESAVSHGTSNVTEFGYRYSQITNLSPSNKFFPPSCFEVQLEAARRASNVKKMIFNGAPSALVSLIGHRQYRRCASDIYYFLQSSICMKQLAYSILELLVISVVPELRDILVDVHKKMQTQPA
ncbi:hypothetical protein Nepgr_025394 [Nepenthes gracilis]|uniref:Sorting nexin-16 n=1 Tax=Nepenthes gracilis TaxID=150966 RepID=A0AAD3Y1F8_NEPGR|nr:hypothetical protein Nepgr_025394 [Nepenthes gracilis]